MLLASAVVVWEWLNEHGRWRPYSPAVSHHIEAVARAGPRAGGSVVLGQADSRLAPYIIDLQSMHQFRQDTGESTRRARCLPPPRGRDRTGAGLRCAPEPRSGPAPVGAEPQRAVRGRRARCGAARPGPARGWVDAALPFPAPCRTALPCLAPRPVARSAVALPPPLRYTARSWVAWPGPAPRRGVCAPHRPAPPARELHRSASRCPALLAAAQAHPARGCPRPAGVTPSRPVPGACRTLCCLALSACSRTLTGFCCPASSLGPMARYSLLSQLAVPSCGEPVPCRPFPGPCPTMPSFPRATSEPPPTPKPQCCKALGCQILPWVTAAHGGAQGGGTSRWGVLREGAGRWGLTRVVVWTGKGGCLGLSGGVVVVWRDSQGDGKPMALGASGMWGTGTHGGEVGTGDLCPPAPPWWPWEGDQPMSLVLGAGVAGCSGEPDTLLCPPSPSSPGGWRGPSPAWGCGDKGPLRRGWGPAS